MWKCLCVWEWKNSCNCESDPVSKANCDRWGADRTVRILKAGAKSITQTTPALPCQLVYPNPPPALVAFVHICSRMFGVRCEKNSIRTGMQMPSHVNPQSSQTKRTRLVFISSVNCILSGVPDIPRSNPTTATGRLI